MYIVGERIKTMAGEEIEDGSKENLCRECAQKQEKYEKKKVERGLRLYDAVCPALQRLWTAENNRICSKHSCAHRHGRNAGD